MSSEIALDLNRRAWQRTKGNVTAIGSWLRQAGGAFEPCMVLMRAGEELAEGAVPCVIPLSGAYRWEPGISNPVDTLNSLMGFLEALRLGMDKGTRTRVMLFINDCLDDLLTMAPRPPENLPGITLGEIVLTNLNTGKTSEHVLRDV